MRQIRFMVATSALQDVVRALYEADSKEFRNEIYIYKEEGDLVVVVTEMSKNKNTYQEEEE